MLDPSVWNDPGSRNAAVAVEQAPLVQAIVRRTIP